MKGGKASHFVSAKKLPNGQWIMIDSNDPSFKYTNTTYMYNNFKELVVDRVNKNTYNKYNSRLLPRLLCYKKKNNNKTNTINQHNNININNNFSSINNSIHNSYNNTTNYNTMTNNYKNSNNKIFYNIHDSMENDDDDSEDSTPTFVSPRAQKEQHNEFSLFNNNEELDEEEFNVFSFYNKENDYNKHEKERTNDISKVNVNNNKYNYNSKNNEIQNQRELEKDSLQLLEAALKNDGYNLLESMRVVNDLYKNENMRKLIINNYSSEEIYNYLCNFGYGYLWEKYIEIISNIFSVRQQIEQLSN